MALLAGPVAVGPRSSPSRAVFGAHETNLGRGRALSERHVAYYAARAAGGAGVVVTETASVHPSDWPYERAPLAERCAEGWRAIALACAPHGTLVLGGLGHAGGQGTSAFSRAAMLAPSPVADPATREQPGEVDEEDLEEVVAGFGAAASLAARCGLGGVEVDAGVRSLLRQFHSRLTNTRQDRYGADRLAVTRAALEAARRGLGAGGVLALRLSCDELAPWGGVTPEDAAGQVDELADLVDLLVVVRGGPYALDAYRPGALAGEAVNLGLATRLRAVVAGRAAVVLQGSVVEVATAEAALATGAADLVEMTRAQIAEPRLVELVRAGTPERVRPCVLCNQACAARDARNPLVSCIGEPSSGHETVEPAPAGRAREPGPALVVGGGPAGLECARVLAARGHAVRLAEASDRLGGALARAAVGPGRERLGRLVAFLEAECRRLGVRIELGRRLEPPAIEAARAAGVAVVLATGSRPATERLVGLGLAAVPGGGVPAAHDVLAVLEAGAGSLPEGPVAVDDPVGGPVGVAIAEWLAAGGRDVAIVSPDRVAGRDLARSGDLVAANGRLERAGVRRELRCRIVAAAPEGIVLEDRFTDARRLLACAAVVDCGHRLPDERCSVPGIARAGDCVAPRSVLEAVLEGRRRALEVAGAPDAGRPLAGATT